MEPFAYSEDRYEPKAVLVFVQHETLAELLDMFLNIAGYFPLVAHSPEDAQKHWDFHSDKIALMITDAQFRGHDFGGVLAREFRSRKSALNVLFLHEGESKLPAVTVDNVEHLQKPFDQNHLLDTVGHLLTTHSSELVAECV